MPIDKCKIFELLKNSDAMKNSQSSSRQPNRQEKRLATRIISLVESAHQCLPLDFEVVEELLDVEFQKDEASEVFEPG